MTGTWSMNLYSPHYGDRETGLLPDGSVTPKYVFGGVFGGVAIVMTVICTAIWCESYTGLFGTC